MDCYTLDKVSNFSNDVDKWSHVCWMDIVDYLVYTTSFMRTTQKEMRAKKSLLSI